MRLNRLTTISLALLAMLAAALPASAATLTVTFTNQGRPLDDPKQGRFYVYPENNRDSYLDWGHAARAAQVPDGEYDVVLRYVNGKIVSERVWEGVNLTGSVARSIEFSIEPAQLTLHVTSGGEAIDRFTGTVNLYRDGKRGKPTTGFRPGSTVIVRSGTYDVEILFRAPDGMKRQWVEGLSVYGSREEVVELGATATRVTFTLVENGEPMSPRQAEWRLYRPGQRDDPVVRAPSGEARTVAPGSYDVGLFYRGAGRRVEQWLPAERLRGSVNRRIDVSTSAAGLTVVARHRGRPVRDAWFQIHAAGDRERALASGISGERIEIGAGSYDIGLFLRREGVRLEQWVEDRQLEGDESIEIDLETGLASLRVETPRRRRRGSAAARVLVLFDSSAKMGRSLGGSTRLERARDVLAESIGLLEGTEATAGLRVFGIAPASRKDCQDSTLLVEPAPLDRRGFNRSLVLLRPSGVSPIAYSLEQAVNDLPADGERVVVLITGGGDDCGGDTCATAARLVAEGKLSRLHVIGVGLGPAQRDGLDCIGNFHPARTDLELRSALRDVFRDVRREAAGSFSIFQPGFSELLGCGVLGESIDVAEGRYDVLVHVGDKTFRWENLLIRGNMSGPARARPPR